MIGSLPCNLMWWQAMLWTQRISYRPEGFWNWSSTLCDCFKRTSQHSSVARTRCYSDEKPRIYLRLMGRTAAFDRFWFQNATVSLKPLNLFWQVHISNAAPVQGVLSNKVPLNFLCMRDSLASKGPIFSTIPLIGAQLYKRRRCTGLPTLHKADLTKSPYEPFPLQDINTCLVSSMHAAQW